VENQVLKYDVLPVTTHRVTRKDNCDRLETPAHRARVLLIKSRANDPNWKLISFPMGLMYIASYLRKVFGHDVRIVDIRLDTFTGRDIEEIVREYSPDVVGISALTFESDAVAWIAAAVKKVNPSTPVLLGGPHPTAYPEKAVETPNIDYAVMGEGEIVAGQLIERLLTSGDVSSLKGIIYKRDGNVIKTERAELLENVDQLPLPAYDLIPIEEYGKYDRFDRYHGYMNVMSSRGCPYRCVYCHNIFGKIFRARSAESLFEEIKYLYDTYQIRQIDILDDIFNFDRERLLKFCDLIVNSGMRITLGFPNGLRGDLLDEAQLRALRRAGTKLISFAIETGSPRVQKVIRKNVKLEVIRRNIEIAHALHIYTHGFFMAGFPSETREDMQMTVDFLLSSKLDTFNLFAVMPFEGTELGRMAQEAGRAPLSDFTLSYHSKNFVNLSAVPDEEIAQVRRRALFRFYVNPLRLFWIVRDLPYKRGLLGLFLLFFKRLFWAE
jgi:radical SAM superfamily enzyme YgiQ (UPF0313 family)